MDVKQQKTRQLVLAALFTAITAVAAQLIIPVQPVPFTFAMVSIYLCGALLEPKAAFAAQAAYLALGAFGAPVFSGFAGGLQKLAGPTGGYLLAYPVMSFIIAMLARHWGRGFLKYSVSMLAALLLCYAAGTVQLMLLMKTGLAAALSMAVLPFAPFDLIKIVLSALLAGALHRALTRARLLAAVC